MRVRVHARVSAPQRVCVARQAREGGQQSIKHTWPRHCEQHAKRAKRSAHLAQQLILLRCPQRSKRVRRLCAAPPAVLLRLLLRLLLLLRGLGGVARGRHRHSQCLVRTGENKVGAGWGAREKWQAGRHEGGQACREGARGRCHACSALRVSERARPNTREE